MKKGLKKFLGLSFVAISALYLSSCGFEQSGATGSDYNNPKNGGFEKAPFVDQETGPGLILIEGGTFTMGRVEQDVTYDWNNTPRRVTMSSFYMDETEVTNRYWLEYLFYLKRIFGVDYPEVYRKALPDTLVWRSKLAYNEPYVEYYLRHPAYADYPVVGVNWLQANDYCAWRSDRVNENILVREGVLELSPGQVNEPFTTDAYLAGQYQLFIKNKPLNMDPNGPETRDIKMEDGILLPKYRLPTEAEWEYASYAFLGNSYDEIVSSRKLYPWTGHWVRNPEPKYQGEMMANFVRGRGDYMGVAGKLNDNADVTAPVYSYWPNDFGLYNMAGNVSEWVMDVYRPLTPQDADEFRPFRGNVFKTKVLNSEGAFDDKYDIVAYNLKGIKTFLTKFVTKVEQPKLREDASEKNIERSPTALSEDERKLVDDLINTVDKAIEFENQRKQQEASELIQEAIENQIKGAEGDVTIAPILLKGIAENIENTPGSIKWRTVTQEENLDRRNYRLADNIDYLDGDLESSIHYESGDYTGYAMYQNGSNAYQDLNTLINDRARVYKGGSWKDRAYWMNGGTRRYMDERVATNYIGFRCAMTRVGSPVGLGF